MRSNKSYRLQKRKKPKDKLKLLHMLILLDQSRRTHLPKPTLPKIEMPFAPEDEAQSC